MPGPNPQGFDNANFTVGDAAPGAAGGPQANNGNTVTMQPVQPAGQVDWRSPGSQQSAVGDQQQGPSLAQIAAQQHGPQVLSQPVDPSPGSGGQYAAPGATQPSYSPQPGTPPAPASPQPASYPFGSYSTPVAPGLPQPTPPGPAPVAAVPAPAPVYPTAHPQQAPSYAPDPNVTPQSGVQPSPWQASGQQPVSDQQQQPSYAPQSTAMLEALRANGVDTSQFASDADYMAWASQVQRDLPYLQTYANYARQTIDGQLLADQQRAHMAGDDGAREAAAWQAPEWDDNWRQYITYDEASGMYVPSNQYANPIIAQKANEFAQWKKSAGDALLLNPAETTWNAGLHQLVENEARQIVQDELRAVRARDATVDFYTNHADKLVVLGPDGQPVIGPGGQPIRTPLGQQFEATHAQLYNEGMTDPFARQNRVMQILGAQFAAATGQAGGQQTGAGGQPTGGQQPENGPYVPQANGYGYGQPAEYPPAAYPPAVGAPSPNGRGVTTFQLDQPQASHMPAVNDAHRNAFLHGPSNPMNPAAPSPVPTYMQPTATAPMANPSLGGMPARTFGEIARGVVAHYGGPQALYEPVQTPA